jgi:hypothetical protein
MTGINNWRVNLEYPEDLKPERAVEYLYEDDEGKTHSKFRKETALAAMLISESAFINSNWWEEKWPKEARETVAICINTNDVFEWGCADSEIITYKEIEEVYRYWVKDRIWGTAIWAMIKNKEMPQRPVEKTIREYGTWDLDDLQKEHGLRANHYDGISMVLAHRKRDVYKQWCEKLGKKILPFDGEWWTGWREYTDEHPDWNNQAWKDEDARLVAKWKRENGYEQEQEVTT